MREVALGGINTSREILANRKAQISKAFVSLDGLICALRSAEFLLWCLSPKRNHTNNLFSFSYIFGININTKEARKHFLYCALGALGERDREIHRARERNRERERERERERRKWRHHCRAKIGDEFTPSLAKNLHLAMSLHFPSPKIRTFRFSLHTSRLTLLKWSSMWRWNSQWFLTFRCQKFRRLFSRLSQGAQLSFLSKKWNKLIQQTIGNIKRDCAWGCTRGDKHHPRKSADRKAQIRKAFVSLTGLICAFRSAEFLGWCLSPERNLTQNLLFHVGTDFGGGGGGGQVVPFFFEFVRLLHRKTFY